MKLKQFNFETLNHTNYPEKEFLKRELGITLKKGLNRNRVSEKNFLYVASNNIRELEDIFKSAESRQIVLLWLGNETYDLNLYRFFQEYKEKIKHLFLCYYPARPTLLNLFKLYIGAMFDKSFFYRWGKVHGFRVAKNGIDLIKRTKIMSKHKNVTALPLGYTNVFVKQIKYFSPMLSSKESVLEFAKNLVSTKKSIEISFFGKEGEWGRHLALNILLKADLNKLIKIKTYGWGGDKFQGTEYFESIFNSRFVLAAPGHISNQSFRYLESLILGALPLTPPSTLQDPHIGNFWTSNNKKIKFYSWTYLINNQTKISETERLKLIEGAILKVKNEIKSVILMLKSFELDDSNRRFE